VPEDKEYNYVPTNKKTAEFEEKNKPKSTTFAIVTFVLFRQQINVLALETRSNKAVIIIGSSNAEVWGAGPPAAGG